MRVFFALCSVLCFDQCLLSVETVRQLVLVESAGLAF